MTGQDTEHNTKSEQDEERPAARKQKSLDQFLGSNAWWLDKTSGVPQELAIKKETKNKKGKCSVKASTAADQGVLVRETSICIQ